ncbi:DUF302 domain-containing protein [Natranaeroarchaeum sulfidigenes]|uniref:DUF302 family n=1 Tax=Natranaeroarchaeum sulfidigenes TaxID=2784880 RepID=A0A897MUR9_9EURY|nr:DUF302 domain-containing protein [Natranaeroarchaeum sulfidigenes]QSG03768.1 DUF302 family [Natranaeroarchaeum sulfidigenes]
MTLPYDPAELTDDDIGEKRATLEMDHEEAIELVREVCAEVGFGIPVEFSPSELLNEKVDADRDPYYVLGACNPAIANRALDVTKSIGGLFPCNMIVWEEEPGKQVVYHVSIMKLAKLSGMVPPDSEEWEAILDETGEMTSEAFEKIEARA